MARVSPLSDEYERAGVPLAPYGPPGEAIGVAQLHRAIEIEYAAIRRHCAIFDWPQRGTLTIAGADRLAFLNRMVTQQVKGLPTLTCRRSFWLNRKGRIEADLRLVDVDAWGGEGGAEGPMVIADVDVHAAARAAAGLGSYLFAEDVRIADTSETLHRLALHGPASRSLVAAVSSAGGTAGAGDVATLGPDLARAVQIAGHTVLVERQDSAGEVGLELTMPAAAARDVYAVLTNPGTHAPATPAGWHAYNIARIEAGWPLYNIDFGPDSLPHETGALGDRVSFTKGCYLGQEVVARMHSLGHPRRRLVALRPEAMPDAAEEGAGLPGSGSPVTAAADPGSEVVGAVTSATLSPMLGSSPVCFAMVKWKFAQTGAAVYVHPDIGPAAKAGVAEGLVFWKREA